MFKFQHSEYLWALLIIPILIGIFLFGIRTRKKMLKKLGDYPLILAMIPDVSRSKQSLKFILYILALSFLIIGICNLQTGSKIQEVKREGADIMICLDVSNSMLAEDLKPNRLERAKQAIEQMIDNLQGDRIGIVVFAGEAYTQLPITIDYASAKLFLNAITPQIIERQGTDISAAIQKATESFGKDEGKNKAIIIITDGEDHEEDAIKASEEAKKNGISVNTIGIGSDAGVPIPVYTNGIPAGYRKDKEGNTVVTRLNEKLLQQIAGAADGVYVKANNADVGLNAIQSKLGELEKKQFESKMYTDYEDQFQWFIGASLFFLAIEFLISERINNWWRKLNLFTK